jgi:hypothetical protein
MQHGLSGKFTGKRDRFYVESKSWAFDPVEVITSQRLSKSTLAFLEYQPSAAPQ